MPYYHLATQKISDHISQINNSFKRIDNDVEALHQLRVYSRRLRNDLKIFSSIFNKKRLGIYDKSIRLMAKESSEARDLDVLIIFLEKYEASQKKKSNNQIRKLISHLVERRSTLQPKVICAIKKFKEQELLLDISRHLKNIKKNNLYRNIYLTASKRIFKRVCAVIKFEKYIDQPKREGEFHKMRIAVKWLRYTLECVQDIYDKQVNIYINTILLLHRELGEIHDYTVWSSMLNKEMDNNIKDKDYVSTLKEINDHCEFLKKETYVQFLKDWKAIRECRIFEELMEFVFAHKDYCPN